MIARTEILAAAADTSPDGILFCDVAGRILHANRAFAALVAPDAPASLNLASLALADVQPPWAVRRVQDDGMPYARRQGAWTGETAIRRLDGSTIPVCQTIVAIHADDGPLLGYSVTLRDLADVKRKEQELQRELEVRRQAEAWANQLSETRSAFLAQMSHELRTPMNGVIAAAEVLANEELPESARPLVNTIQSCAHHLLSVINGVLDLTKIESGNVELECGPVVLRDLLADVESMYRLPAEKKGLGFEVEIASTVPQSVTTDGHRLKQILTNLLSNAVRFTHQGDVTVQVEVPEPGTVNFSVVDTGIGIPRDRLRDIFTPFAQADRSTTRRYGGTGLGLSIVKGLVSELGGRIGVASREGQGSRFRVSLPLTTVEPAAKPERDTATGQMLDLDVVVVDDDAVNRLVAGRMTEMLGARVRTFDGGGSLLEALPTDESPPDLILLDLQMPEMDGWTTYEKLKTYYRDQNMELPRIYILSASCLDSDRERAAALGIEGFLTKPLTSGSLLSAFLDFD